VIFKLTTAETPLVYHLFSLEVLGAESLQSVSKFVDNFRLGANNHSEETFLEEALTRESQTVLVGKQLLAEVNVVLNTVEHLKLDANHHVHSRTRLNRSHTLNTA
jgi:3-deoxy-D-arabino-heptulosonate 7-phosphate (DAHP) synthase